MIRPDLDLVRTIADAVAVQEGRRGGSVSAHTLALEAKTVIAYAEYLERATRKQCAEILGALEEHHVCLKNPRHLCDLGDEIRRILGAGGDDE